jgi:hypothetical protein
LLRQPWLSSFCQQPGFERLPENLSQAIDGLGELASADDGRGANAELQC